MGKAMVKINSDLAFEIIKSLRLFFRIFIFPESKTKFIKPEEKDF